MLDKSLRIIMSIKRVDGLDAVPIAESRKTIGNRTTSQCRPQTIQQYQI